MTEIPAHLLKRTQEARAKSQVEPTQDEATVEVPLAMLERLREHYGTGNFPTILALVSLIPEPAYEPDPQLVSDYAQAQGYSILTAEDELIQLHKAGFIITGPNDQPTERN